jgi:hypothetical protein
MLRQMEHTVTIVLKRQEIIRIHTTVTDLD